MRTVVDIDEKSLREERVALGATTKVAAEWNRHLPVVVASGPDAPSHGKNASKCMTVL